jgi:hypothetical protein
MVKLVLNSVDLVILSSQVQQAMKRRPDAGLAAAGLIDPQPASGPHAMQRDWDRDLTCEIRSKCGGNYGRTALPSPVGRMSSLDEISAA